MEQKKSKKANLEDKRLLFLEIGFIFSLGLAFLAFEWTSKPGNTDGLKGLQDIRKSNFIQDHIPVTRQQKTIKPPPPPKTTEILNIIDNDFHIEDELKLEKTEPDRITRVEIETFTVNEGQVQDEQTIFFVAEEMPMFRGNGIAAFRDYVQGNIEYPDSASKKRIEGTVFLSFVVNTNGSVSNVKIMKSVDPLLNKEATRVVKTAPKWKPGIHMGKPVKVQYVIPVVFTLH